MVKFCTKCSAPLADGSAHCLRCNASNLNTCSQCGTVNNSTANYCQGCSAYLPQPVQPLYNNIIDSEPTFVSSRSFNVQNRRTMIIIAGVVLLLGTSIYSFYLKNLLDEESRKSNELKIELERKNSDIERKSGTIDQLQTKTDGLTSDNEDLKTKLDGKIKEVNKRLSEVKKLQGSLKTVSVCLKGIVGGIESLQRNDEYLARQSLLQMQSTCEDAGKIVKQFETFNTN